MKYKADALRGIIAALGFIMLIVGLVLGNFWVGMIGALALVFGLRSIVEFAFVVLRNL